MTTNLDDADYPTADGLADAAIVLSLKAGAPVTVAPRKLSRLMVEESLWRRAGQETVSARGREYSGTDASGTPWTVMVGRAASGPGSASEALLGDPRFQAMLDAAAEGGR